MNGWRDRAACRGHPPEMWFSSTTSDLHRQARQICRGCPVRWDCLEESIQRSEFGIWGGYDDDERRSIWRKALREITR